MYICILISTFQTKQSSKLQRALQCRTEDFTSGSTGSKSHFQLFNSCLTELNLSLSKNYQLSILRLNSQPTYQSLSFSNSEPLAFSLSDCSLLKNNQVYILNVSVITVPMYTAERVFLYFLVI